MSIQPGHMQVGPQFSFEVLKREWGWFMALGIIMIIVGLIAIFEPVAATFAFTTVIGILLLIGGVAHGIHAILSRQWSGFLWQILAAIVYIAAGVLLLTYPLGGVFTLTLLLGIYLLFSGFVRIISSLTARPMPQWGWVLFSGILGLILGVLILVQLPSTAEWVLGLLVGIDLFFAGWAMLMLSIAARSSGNYTT